MSVVVEAQIHTNRVDARGEAAGKRRTMREIITGSTAALMPIAPDPLAALMIDKAGFEVLCVGGLGTSAMALGLPDIGFVGVEHTSNLVRTIRGISPINIMADGDHGYGDEAQVFMTMRRLEAAGASAVFFEDQRSPKSCGHMDVSKQVVSQGEMVARLQSALAGRQNPETVIMARTDARGIEGLDSAIKRARLYYETGVDMVFIEAPQSEEELRIIGRELAGIPMMANMIEGARTPLVPQDRLSEMGYKLISYPLTALMAYMHNFQHVLESMKQHGDTSHVLGQLATFEDVNNLLGLPVFSALRSQNGK